LWLGSHGPFELQHLWYLSVGSVTLQMLCSLMLLLQQFRLRLTGVSAAALS
jgi:hypothetical protein